MVRICHFSSAHKANDIRIVRKEAVAAASSGYDVVVVIQGDLPVDCHLVRHVPFASAGAGRLGRFLITSARVARIARRQSADIYHFHDPDLLPFALLLCAQGFVVIYDAHEDVPRDILSKHWIPGPLRKCIAHVFEWFEDLAAGHLSAIVAATPFIGERFRKYNPNTTVINNYPFLNELTAAESREITADAEPDSERRGFCYVGGISLIRSALEIVRAAELGGHSLSIAGPMETPSLLARLTMEPGWAHVEYLGVLERPGVASLMRRSLAGLVLFHPEPNHVNAQPNKLFEYMSAGLPVIASNFPLWRDIVERLDCGICVDPLDPSSIATAMTFITENPERARRMGHNGREAIIKHFSWENERNNLLDLYRSLSPVTRPKH